jgi:hypothetical protein
MIGDYDDAMISRHIRCAGLAAACVLLGGTTAGLAQQAGSPGPQELARIWDAEHVSPPLPPLMDNADVERRLRALSAKDPDRFAVQQIGKSVEGRPIDMVTVGHGPFRVLLWSQMHGDEPTATAALFDIFEYLDRHRDDASVRRLTSALTVYFIPMLNPDGAERFQRRNAQGIDINRDALRLQTPEGRALKEVRDCYKPRVGFNLHNENWRTSVGTPPKPASVSLLSVAYDTARHENAGRRLTKRICAVVRDALEPFASGQIGRYDDAFEVRAFGDNLTLWGTPVVLIETGPYPSAEPDPPLVRLNFIGILSALDALATGAVDKADPSRYESLPQNASHMEGVIVRNATVINGAGVPGFTADVGINLSRRVVKDNRERRLQVTATIADLGDLRTEGALREIDGTGLVVVPLFDQDITRGQQIQLPDWSATPAAHTVSPGQPGDLLLLRADTAGYRVEMVLTF